MSFIDAYHTAPGRRAGHEAIYSYDRDFERLKFPASSLNIIRRSPRFARDDSLRDTQRLRPSGRSLEKNARRLNGFYFDVPKLANLTPRVGFRLQKRRLHFSEADTRAMLIFTFPSPCSTCTAV